MHVADILQSCDWLVFTWKTVGEKQEKVAVEPVEGSLVYCKYSQSTLHPESRLIVVIVDMA